jgi:lipid A 3-O-deacylase
VFLGRSGRLSAPGLIILIGLALARPASAQVVFGSPADPPSVALGGGAYDVIREPNKPGSGVTGLVLGEYRFGDIVWGIAPFIGAMGTGSGMFYGYGGVGFDVTIAERFVVTPNFAVGYYNRGRSIELGSHCEFRSGAEFGYRFEDQKRIAIGFYHMSNAGLGKQNPGVELATFVVTVPFR